MKFFFPDSQDQIDPSFDFVSEERSILRVRQRDDLYAHEALTGHVIDGLLVSKAIVDGIPGAAGKYTLAQRHRLYRAGVRQFFRLDTAPGPRLLTMGDCGAFSYIRDDVPPYTPGQVIDFYEECGFDLGISIDHVIFGYDPAADHDPRHPQAPGWNARQQLTLDLAAAVPRRVPQPQDPVHAHGGRPGMEPGLLRLSSPRAAEDRLPPYRRRRHGPPQDP